MRCPRMDAECNKRKRRLTAGDRTRGEGMINGKLHGNPDDYRRVGLNGGSLFMVIDGGKCDDGKGNSWALGSTPSGSPVLLSNQTKRYFTIGWEEIIQHALERGLDDPDMTPDDVAEALRGKAPTHADE